MRRIGEKAGFVLQHWERPGTGAEGHCDVNTCRRVAWRRCRRGGAKAATPKGGGRAVTEIRLCWRVVGPIDRQGKEIRRGLGDSGGDCRESVVGFAWIEASKMERRQFRS